MAKTFEEICEARYSRRSFLRGAGAVAATGLAMRAFPANATSVAAKEIIVLEETTALSSLTFAEVGRGNDEHHHIAEGYKADVLIRWGDPIKAHMGAFDPAKLTDEEQNKRFGFNNDYTVFFPMKRGSDQSDRGLLGVNHEYSLAHLMFSGLVQDAEPMPEQIKAEMASIGTSVIEVRKKDGTWEVNQNSLYNRRITPSTPMKIAGPAAGNVRMQTSADPKGTKVLGTFGNCAGGMTPWGTYLTCEENVDKIFRLEGDYPLAEKDNYTRFGVEKSYTWNYWHKVEERFNVDKEPNEANRFGWVVEIDPYDPKSTPVKRTALGRFKHESASCHLMPDNRVVVYSGDDEAFQYLYKFVSARACNPQNPRANREILDEGTLFAAKFLENGTLQWLPLVQGVAPLVEENGFFHQADVVIEARRAAELMGATPMDRPEDVEVNPLTGLVYANMTKNPSRTTANAANPRTPNIFGHTIEMIPPTIDGIMDHSAVEFQWDMFLKGGDPEKLQGALYHGGVSENGWLACPDNMAFDVKGRIWITTDGQPKAIGSADALYAMDTQGEGRGISKAFFRGPTGCEMTGPSFTPDGKTLFLSVQHPGDDKLSSFDEPSTRWPDFDPALPPRPAVLAITKEDGGIIGGYAEAPVSDDSSADLESE